MKLKITYPPVEERSCGAGKFCAPLRWLVLFAAMLCPALNLAVGGKAWSLIVLMSLYMVWTLALSPALVEYKPY